MMDIDIVHVIVLLIVLIVSVWLHEYAHALVSYKLWDPTPKLQNRLTPNPLRHLDPYGTIMMVVMVISWWGVGWGKPVQINPMYYKKPVQWELIVALAWPVTNIFLSIIGVFIIIVYWKLVGYGLIDISQMMWELFSPMRASIDIVVRFFGLFSIVNVMLALFNLIPLPPLDWFNLVKSFLPKVAYFIEQYRMYVMIGFLLFILWPWRNIFGYVLSTVGGGILNTFFTLFSQIIY